MTGSRDAGGGDEPGGLAAQLREALEAIQARDEFLAIAAHELRSPLNALGLQLAVLERQAASSGVPQLQAQVARARHNVDRYIRRASALLDVSRLASGQLQPERRHVALRDVVQLVLDAYQDEAQLRRVAIDAHIEGDPAGLWDERMVEEMLSNLVSNALRYGAGSPVRIRAGGTPGGLAWFEVADDGPGIPEAEREFVFGKFSRAVSHSRDRGGFGLGLWIVAGMAASLQGSIELRTPAEGGAVFVVTLPTQPRLPTEEKHRS